MITTTAIRVPQREIEALLGGALLNTVGKAAEYITLKKSKLVPKRVHLPRCGYTMHYHEREAVPVENDEVGYTKNQQTIMFFHGISQKSQDLATFIASLDIPPHVRILCPEQMGHGRDIERAVSDPNYKQPTHELMLESTSEFLDVVEAGNNVNAFGISLGGAVCYYVANERPDIIKRTVLVSPAIIPCVDSNLLAGIQDGTNRFICFESREDVKLLMRDLSTGRDDDNRKKRDPVPKFFHESIYRMSKRKAPEGHYMEMLLSLLKNAGLTRSGTPGYPPTSDMIKNGSSLNPFSALTDIDRDRDRLVIWPEKDQIINFEQGKCFFEVSSTEEGTLASKSRNTKFEMIPDCGHVFHSDGRSILDIIRPRVREYLLEFTPPGVEIQLDATFLEIQHSQSSMGTRGHDYN